MAISDNYEPDVTQGNGATTIYTGSWSPLVASYMRVYLRLRSTGELGDPLDQGAGVDEYTLSFTSAGYSITLGTAPSSLYDVVRSREVARDQTNPYTTARGFDGTVEENSFDKLTAITQDLADDISRSITFQIGSTSTATLPEPAANNLLGWNSAGDDLENKVAIDITGTTVSAFMATLLDDSTALEALTTLGAAGLLANTFTGMQTLSGAAVNLAAEVDVASNTTADIGAAASNNVRVTGTTTITGLGTATAGITRNIRFASALILTHNATSLILPGAANITTAANDTMTALSLGSGNWIVTSYKRQSSLGSKLKVGNFTFDVSTASGSIVTTGVGFTPRLLILFGAINASAAASFGFSDGTTQSHVAKNDGGTADNWTTGTTLIGQIITGVGAFQQFSLSSFDTDGFTLANTKTGSPTGTARFGYAAIGGV